MQNLKLIAAAIALIAGGVWLGHSLTDATRVVTDVQIVERTAIAPPSSKAAETEMALANPLGQSFAAPASTGKTSELGIKLLQATDVKAFVIDALKHPEKGGAFYARLALKQCDGYEQGAGQAVVQRIVAAESTIDAARLAAITAPSTRCAGFAEGEIAALQNEARRIALSGADPKMKMMTDWSLAKIRSPERKAAFERIAESGDMAVISEVDIPFLMMRSFKNESGSLSTRFNGQVYGPEDLQALLAADMLGTCTGGDYCKLDLMRMGRCWGEGDCYATREEFVRQGMLKGDQAAYAKAMKVAEQIRQAMASGDTSIFK